MAKDTHKYPLILRSWRRDYPALDMPSDVPWGPVAACARQLMRNHGQTPDELAQRGGLDPRELYRAHMGLGSHHPVEPMDVMAYIRDLTKVRPHDPHTFTGPAHNPQRKRGQP